MDIAFRQFYSCASALGARISRDQVREVFSADSKFIETWYADFLQDIYLVSSGYPKVKVRKTPDIEDRVRELLVNRGIEVSDNAAPTLILTHDVDYLWATPQLFLKRMISEKKLCRLGENFLPSVEALLTIDSGVAGKAGVSTIFIACLPSRRYFRTLLQDWIIDPSYRPHNLRFEEFKQLADRYQCEIGLHGSYNSLGKDRIGEEHRLLEATLKKKVTLGRQHWLNLCGTEDYEKLRATGIETDSTLGWNGSLGFRGGMARPFALELPNGKSIRVVPMLLMDGVMFADLKMSEAEVVESSVRLLKEVEIRGGTVAVNWHGRVASPSYGWQSAYEKILRSAKDRGFGFCNISEGSRKVEIR